MMAATYQNGRTISRYKGKGVKCILVFEFFLPLMSACPETTRGADAVRAETRRKEIALLHKVTGISRSRPPSGKGDLERKTKICQKETN